MDRNTKYADSLVSYFQEEQLRLRAAERAFNGLQNKTTDYAQWIVSLIELHKKVIVIYQEELKRVIHGMGTNSS